MEKREIRAFEGLRFIFAISIFLNHCNFLKETSKGDWVFEHVFHGGVYGVIFFFILSGFGLYKGYANKFQRITWNNYMIFIKKRLQKVYGLYMISMLWAFIYNILHGESIVENLSDLGLGATMLQTMTVTNWGILNSAAWFVSCIFCLYLITPFMLRILTKLSSQRVPMAIITCYLLIVTIDVIRYVLVSKGVIGAWNGFLLTYIWPIYRIPYLLLGMLLAKMRESALEKKVRNWNIWEMGTILLAIIAYLIGLNGSTWLVEWRNTYWILSIMSLIIIFSAGKGKISSILSNDVLVKLGKNSMSFYLLHWVVIWYGGHDIVSSFVGKGNVSLGLEVVILFALTLFLSGVWERVKEIVDLCTK